jgi:hypothetical protein
MPRILIRDKPIFSSERMLHKDYYSRSSVEKESLVVGLKGLNTKIITAGVQLKKKVWSWVSRGLTPR